MKKSVFKEGKKYTFKDYFELPNPTEEILNELGYSYSLGVLELPRSENCDTGSVSILKDIGVTHLDFKSLILLIAICAMHNAASIKINRLIFQLRKS